MEYHSMAVKEYYSTFLASVEAARLRAFYLTGRSFVGFLLNETPIR